MPLDATMIKFYYTGGGTMATSLGGAQTSNLCGATINSIFGNLSSAECTSGVTKYKAIDVKNEDGVKSITDAALFRSIPTSSANTEIQLAYDSVGTQSIVNETTPPVGLSFSNIAVDRASGISLGTPWTPGQKKRIWLKLIVNAGSAALSGDSGELKVIGDRIP